MNRVSILLLPILLSAIPLTNIFSQEQSERTARVTVLDRNVHVEKDLILDIPRVPRLCDGMTIVKQHISIGDCKLYCELEGEGIPLVLINGGPGGTHHEFHPEFSRVRDHAKVIYYDQRGCGLSEYVEGRGYTVEQAIEDLDRLRDALKVKKWVVLGHSYGGFLAQCYTIKYPEHTMGLVLVGAQSAIPLKLDQTRQYDFMSKEELRRINEIYNNDSLSLEQSVFNAHLNGDWKRQNYYKPSREQLARMALYEWKHDERFRRSVGQTMDAVDLQGAFENSPIPTLIMEGKWDLTWNTDKANKLHACFPGSQLVVFERSGHSPFRDEPEWFFQTLKEFVQRSPKSSDADISLWQADLTKWLKEKEQSPRYFLTRCGYGRKSNETIAQQYSKEWLDQLGKPHLILKTGFALYDLRRYEEALGVFKKMSQMAQDDTLYLAVAFIWQGHMLDLLGRREQAISIYERVVKMNVKSSMSHDQFGMSYSPSSYAAKRVQQPFARVENRWND